MCLANVTKGVFISLLLSDQISPGCSDRACIIYSYLASFNSLFFHIFFDVIAIRCKLRSVKKKS